MKTKKQFLLLTGILTVAVVLLMSTGSALAHENVETGTVDLFIDGKLPVVSEYSLQFKSNADFESYMISKLKAMDDEIDLSSFGLSCDEFHQVYQNLLNAHPELFFVDGGYSYSYSSDGKVTSIWPSYRYPAQELEQRVLAFNQKLDEIVAYANQSSTIVGKLLRANDYFCVNFQYDTSYSIYEPDQLFALGKGVCQAYMMGYTAVLNELGIPSFSVVSSAMNHTWNVVQVDGSWYHVDVTWNDPVPNAPNRARHVNFLRSNAGIEETGHYGWVPKTSASSTRFDDYFWNNVDHPVSLLDEVAYYTPATGGKATRVESFSLITGQTNVVHNYNFQFPYYYSDISPVWATPSRLYYGMGNGIYAVPLGGGTSELVFSADNQDEYMFYIYHSGSQMYVTAYNYTEREYKGYQFTVDEEIEYELTMKSAVLMQAGSTMQLSAELSPSHSAATLLWSSSDLSVAVVNADGSVDAIAPGMATIRAAFGDLWAECQVVVCSVIPMKLADGTLWIEAHAFDGTSLAEAVLPNGLKEIGSKAFENCSKLWLAVIPPSVENIAADAFGTNKDMLLVCAPDSAAQIYAVQNGLRNVVIEGEWPY